MWISHNDHFNVDHNNIDFNNHRAHNIDDDYFDEHNFGADNHDVVNDFHHRCNFNKHVDNRHNVDFDEYDYNITAVW